MDEAKGGFQFERPIHLGDEHWNSIAQEVGRLNRSQLSGDEGQVLGDLKGLVEAVARITVDISGEQVEANSSFSHTVNRAHKLLEQQPGYELATGSEFGKIARQACHMAAALGSIRNQFGSGHGRAYVPEIKQEMTLLATDGSMTWLRWALRRIGLFSLGRPEILIRDLVEQRATFRSGDLKERLEAVNIPNLTESHQRALGVAVGQRVMEGTFVVRWDGLDPCLRSDNLGKWTENYRIGLLRGLWNAHDEKPTITPQSIKYGLEVLDPIPDASHALSEQIEVIRSKTKVGLPDISQDERSELWDWIRAHREARPKNESPAYTALMLHIEPPPF